MDQSQLSKTLNDTVEAGQISMTGQIQRFVNHFKFVTYTLYLMAYQ